MFWPNCENLESLDWNSMLIELAISVAMVSLSDLESSYFVYCKGFPLSEGFTCCSATSLLKCPSAS